MSLVNIKTDICPLCRKTWDKKYLRDFLKSIIPLLPSMTQSERWVFFSRVEY